MNDSAGKTKGTRGCLGAHVNPHSLATSCTFHCKTPRPTQGPPATERNSSRRALSRAAARGKPYLRDLPGLALLPQRLARFRKVLHAGGHNLSFRSDSRLLGPGGSATLSHNRGATFRRDQQFLSHDPISLPQSGRTGRRPPDRQPSRLRFPPRPAPREAATAPARAQSGPP